MMNGREFARQLLREVRDRHGEKRDIVPAGLEQAVLPDFLLKHWLNFAVYYERAAVSFIGGWLKTTAEGDALVHFAHQIEDEANHYKWLRQHLEAFGVDVTKFEPPPQWRTLMDDFYPSLETLVERLAAHNIASETGALGFMDFNLERFPAAIRETVEAVSRDERYHVAFGQRLLGKYCQTAELQARARAATDQALELMRRGREVFVRI